MVEVVACSVRGPAHIAQSEPCQDAWMTVRDKEGSLAVVCDGMGSSPQARAGARAGCIAARDTWRLWRKSKAGTGEDFIRIMESAWRLRLGEILPENAATTCLVYAENKFGSAFTAQLGDGLIARCDKTAATIFRTNREEFGFTKGLGTIHKLADWSYSIGPVLTSEERLLMATDGVAEDLLPDRVADLATWIVNEISLTNRPGLALSRELKDWPVPFHRDDKTLLVMWKR